MFEKSPAGMTSQYAMTRLHFKSGPKKGNSRPTRDFPENEETRELANSRNRKVVIYETRDRGNPWYKKLVFNKLITKKLVIKENKYSFGESWGNNDEFDRKSIWPAMILAGINFTGNRLTKITLIVLLEIESKYIISDFRSNCLQVKLILGQIKLK